MPITLQPYQRRSIRCLDLWGENGWKIKVYVITAANEMFDHGFIDIAKDIARNKLPHPPETADRYGVGCLTIHTAKMFNQIIVNWWERENELRHHVFKAYPATPYSFEEITATGEAFCIWELRVIGFERQAWIDSVLLNQYGPSIKNYINSQLNEVI